LFSGLLSGNFSLSAIQPETIFLLPIPLSLAAHNWPHMKEITAQQLQEKLQKKDEFQLIDVREEYEFEAANIGGDLIPMSDVFDNVDKIDRNKMVVIYCRSGNRSGVVIQALEKQFGFTNLYNLKGGILAYARDVDPSLAVQ
jgi:rhodanese-related sulfurtransferase